MDLESQKHAAAAQALTLIEDGMTLGLGTGSTAAKFIDLLGAAVADGLNVRCVATSRASAAQAKALSIPLITLDDEPFLDLTVDGADEINPDLGLIKGGGGALLHEKIVASASGLMVVIADASKFKQQLGAFPLPLEVIRFGLPSTAAMVEAICRDDGLEGEITLRKTSDGTPFVTDSGNFVLDCAFGAIPNPEDLDEALHLVPGVVETGLFLGIADMAIIAGADGITVLQADDLEELDDDDEDDEDDGGPAMGNGANGSAKST